LRTARKSREYPYPRRGNPIRKPLTSSISTSVEAASIIAPRASIVQLSSSKRFGARLPHCGRANARIRGTVITTILASLLLPSLVAAQKPAVNSLRDLELCNGSERSSLDSRISGCSALIDSHQSTAIALAISYNNRGNAYVAKGDYDRAIQDFNESIKLAPDFAKPYNNRGAAYLLKGEYDLAIQTLDQAIRLDPGYAKAFANRAEAHLKKNEYDRASPDHDEAIRLTQDLDQVWNGRCWTRAVLGALPAALEDCNRALQSELNKAATYDSRGMVHLKMGALDAAVEDYSSALTFDPKLASSLYGRGLARLKMGDMTGGNADISAAKAIRSTIVEDFLRYGVR
jgi:tetratricopeptide (TPR) repeat protein